MAKKTGGEHAPRDQHKKRPRTHKKCLNKAEKRQKKNKKYKGQGRGWQISFSILYIGHERNNNKQKEENNA